MARTFNNEAMARHVVQLRSAARRGDSDALEGAITDLERSLTESATLSKRETARVLHVSVNTLDTWIDRGLVQPSRSRAASGRGCQQVPSSGSPLRSRSSAGRVRTKLCSPTP